MSEKRGNGQQRPGGPAKDAGRDAGTSTAPDGAAGLPFEGHRAGFAALIGRPNSGKSTLTNALVGTKVAITSSRPQTTRRAIRGIVTRPGSQIVLVDTPGVHRPRTLLGERLNDVVGEAAAEADVVAICLPAPDPIGPGDRRIIATRPAHVPAIAIVTKADLISRAQLAAKLAEVAGLADFEEIIPVSALTGEQVGELADVLAAKMPFSPPLYPDGQTRDESDELMIAELVREAALEGVRDEIPHSLAVTVEEIERDGKLIRIHAALHVERDSQKGIIIGKGGARLREVGMAARREIERALGARVYLDLRVRVAKDWQRDPKQLRRLGL